MEAAALAAVARFRGVPLAQVVCGADDLSGEIWDDRSWQGRSQVRDNLIEVAGTAALEPARVLPAPAPAPRELAAFYARLLDWPVTVEEAGRPGFPPEDGFAQLRPPVGRAGPVLSFE
jgi:hypothetical protein